MMSEDEAKIAWLRAAAQEGFDAIDRGDYTALNSADEIDAFINDIHQEVSRALTNGTRA